MRYMKRSLLPIILAAFILLAACEQKPSSVTKISGTVPEGDSIENVAIMTWVEITPDSVAQRAVFVPVVDGRFEAEIPTCISEISSIRGSMRSIPFVADGTSLTADLGTPLITSSSKKGVHSRYTDYIKAGEAIIDEMDEKAAPLKPRHEAGEDVRQETLALQEEYIQRCTDMIMKTIAANHDNAVGAEALSDLNDFCKDFDLLSRAARMLSDRIQKNSTASRTISSIERHAATAVGNKFIDFEVVQDPEHPETSTVRLSDYVGHGKYILADFWASWCGPCRADIPVLKYIYEKYRGERFEIVGIAVHDQPEATLAAAEELDIPWPLILNANTPQTKLYGINGIPHTILFDPDGIILAKDLHGHALDAVLEKYLE